MDEREERSVWGHFQRGLGEPMRHNSLAYGYSVAITATFGVAVAEGDRPDVPRLRPVRSRRRPRVPDANAAVTRGYRQRVEEEPEIVLALGTLVRASSCSRGVRALLGRERLEDP